MAGAENQNKSSGGYIIDAHKIEIGELVDRYTTNLDEGLRDEDVIILREQYGFNELTPTKGKPQWFRLLYSMFHGLFNLLLQGGAILCFIAYALKREDDSYLYLGIILSCVVMITGVFMFYQESKSSAIMESFKSFLPQEVNVLRNGGTLIQIEARELVPGDIVSLKSGDKLPADIRIFQCSDDSQVDNSSLTGEAEPQDRGINCSSDDPLETKNLAFFGTLLVRGKCKGIVVKTADSTYMGSIANLADDTGNEQTPIGHEIDRFIKMISVVAITLGIIFGVILIIQTKPKNLPDAVPIIVFVIGIIVANVPEGLLATVTVALTLTAKRMASKAVLVKNLQAVETLGSTSVICSDKTGTLTMNKMTVGHVSYELSEFECDTENPLYGQFDSSNETFQHLLRCSVLCNNACYKNDGSISGDASETAMIKFSNPHYNNDIQLFRDKYKIKHEIPFNSANKQQVSIHENYCKNVNLESSNKQSNFLLVLKGAPERVIGFCDEIRLNGENKPMDEKSLEEIRNGVACLGKKGERVLGFCQLELNSDDFAGDFTFTGDSRETANFPFGRGGERGLVFIGLMSMIDPPRPGVPQAVSKCQDAGIRVIMVTGDHPITAKAIAQKVGIIRHPTIDDIAASKNIGTKEVRVADVKAIVVTGTELRQKIENSSADFICTFWNEVLFNEDIVFARTSPQQKLQIVKAVQERGGIVAVTGDGVNDSPALKAASIGVAMGKSGTDVAKSAADMILLDDNFASIVNGVEEGRIIFDNLKKSIAYTLSSNIPEIIPFLLSVCLSIPLPLTTIMILFVDLGTDMLPAISLAYERREADIMRRDPRNPDVDNLVTWRLISFAYLQIGVIQALAGIYAYMVVLNYHGILPKYLIGLDKNLNFSTCGDNGGNKYMFCFEEKYLNKWCHFSDIGDVSLAFPTAGPLAIPPMDCDARDLYLRESNTAYFVSIIIVQWADLLICKTRIKSIYTQGMSNKFMNFSLLFELALAVLLVYLPLHRGLKTAPLRFVFWTSGMPFCMIIFGYDELRKLYIRKHRHGWLERTTYW